MEPAGASPFAPAGPGPVLPSSPDEGTVSENPYQSPSTYCPADGAGFVADPSSLQAYAARRVAVPAIGLILVGGGGLAIQILLVAIFAIGALAPDGFAFEPPIFDDAPGPLVVGGVLIGFLGAGAVLNLLILLGGLKMRRLESYGFAMAASILALFPHSCCTSHPCCFPMWLLGLIFGIWGLVVLSNGYVRASFVR